MSHNLSLNDDDDDDNNNNKVGNDKGMRVIRIPSQKARELANRLFIDWEVLEVIWNEPISSRR